MDMKNSYIRILWMAGLVLCLASCRKDDDIFIPETVPVAPSEVTSIKGFYLLNEGNMGSNKSTLDYYDYETGDIPAHFVFLADMASGP
jgi:hypothetical protein